MASEGQATVNGAYNTANGLLDRCAWVRPVTEDQINILQLHAL